MNELEFSLVTNGIRKQATPELQRTIHNDFRGEVVSHSIVCEKGYRYVSPGNAWSLAKCMVTGNVLQYSGQS